MASENESEKRETIAEVVATMRQGTKLRGYWKSQDLNEILAYHADRIEAALKREKAEAEADALTVGGVVEAARHTPGNAAALREAQEAINRIETRRLKYLLMQLVEADIYDGGLINKTISAIEKARRALSAPPYKGKWKNGKMYEYEYAFCSECGRMQWAGWDTHQQAKENIESFAHDYKFCPGCGAEMEGGVYVN